MDIWSRNAESSKSGETEGEDKDTLIILMGCFMRFHLGVEVAREAFRRAVATLEKDSGESVRRGGKVREWDSVHGRKEGEEDVQEIRVVIRTQSTFTCL